MVREWRLATLDQLGRIVTGKTPRSSCTDCFGGVIPFVTPSDFDGRRLIDRAGRHLTPQGAVSIGYPCIPPRAVMVSCIGENMGRPAIAGHECVTNQQINSLVVESGDDPLFVYYNLSARRTEIRSIAGGSAQPILNKSGFGKLEIALPSRDEQRAIAHILGTFDDKIELNRKQYEALDGMVRALFKSWFADFEPVRARMKGRDTGLAREIAALFPSRLLDSDCGERPEGWEELPLYDVAEYINGAVYSAFEPNDDQRGLPIVKIAELKAGVTLQTRFSAVPMPEKYRIRPADILFSWSGNPATSIDTFVWQHADAWLNQHIFRVVPRRPEERSFVLALLRHMRPVFAEIARNKQTTGLGHVTAADLKRLRVVWPAEPVMRAWAAIADPLLERMLLGQMESGSLAALRDAILPKLIRGEVRALDAEKLIARVA